MCIYFVCKLSSQKSPFLSINKTAAPPCTSPFNLHSAQSVILSLVELCNVMQLQEKQKQRPNQNGLSPKIALIWGSTNTLRVVAAWTKCTSQKCAESTNSFCSCVEKNKAGGKKELSMSTAETPLPLPVLSVSCRLKNKARSGVHREQMQPITALPLFHCLYNEIDNFLLILEV